MDQKSSKDVDIFYRLQCLMIWLHVGIGFGSNLSKHGKYFVGESIEYHDTVHLPNFQSLD